MGQGGILTENAQHINFVVMGRWTFNDYDGGWGKENGNGNFD